MDIPQVQIIAGMASTLLYVSSTLPMLSRAFRTRDLASYSFAHIMLTNVGNWVYWLYVASLPVGPIWLLHGFNTTAAGLMLIMYLRYAKGWGRRAQSRAPATPLTTVEMLVLSVECCQ